MEKQYQATEEYEHQRELGNINSICKTLNELNEKLVKSSVRCHLLQVDLATQFSPHMVHTLDNTVQDCEHCTTKLAALGPVS